MPAHHKLEVYLDEYLDAAGIRGQGRTPLFRSTIGKTGILTGLPMHAVEILQSEAETTVHLLPTR